MTPSEQMLLAAAREDAIVERAEAMITPLLAVRSAREILEEWIGIDNAEVEAGIEGDYVLALCAQARKRAEREMT